MSIKGLICYIVFMSLLIGLMFLLRYLRVDDYTGTFALIYYLLLSILILSIVLWQPESKKKPEHKHKFVDWEGSDYRVVVLKTSSCSCGAVRMLTHYGWRTYKDGKIISEK